MEDTTEIIKLLKLIKEDILYTHTQILLPVSYRWSNTEQPKILRNFGQKNIGRKLYIIYSYKNHLSNLKFCGKIRYDIALEIITGQVCPTSDLGGVSWSVDG
jgi:hypothetical protein